MPAPAACATDQQLLAHGLEDCQSPSRGASAQEQHHVPKGQADSDLGIIDLTGEAAMPVKHEVITCAHDQFSILLPK